ncbi:MAG TPA: SDR family oxidoreductase [Solirubrobacteraceae bacterium]|nr:SDR family oxidoreductase [Solirubrobacteraceae bacterium]
MSLAVITGGASGIGLACARLMAADGWDVTVLDRRPPVGDGLTFVAADVTDEGALNAVADGLSASIAALICSAGIWEIGSDGSPATLSLEAWERTIAVNLTGTMLTVRSLLGRMADDSSIVTLGSVAGLAGMPGGDAYTATKGGVIALTRAWAVDFSQRGIRVNCVCPGPTRTPMINSLMDSLDESRRIRLPQQRPATADEIAAVIKFLCQPEASYLSGQILAVDGGATAALAGLPFPRRREGPA